MNAIVLKERHTHREHPRWQMAGAVVLPRGNETPFRLTVSPWHARFAWGTTMSDMVGGYGMAVVGSTMARRRHNWARRNRAGRWLGRLRMVDNALASMCEEVSVPRSTCVAVAGSRPAPLSQHGSARRTRRETCSTCSGPGGRRVGPMLQIGGRAGLDRVRRRPWLFLFSFFFFACFSEPSHSRVACWRGRVRPPGPHRGGRAVCPGPGCCGPAARALSRGVFPAMPPASSEPTRARAGATQAIAAEPP